MNLQLLAQAFNLTNRANYGNNFGPNATPPLAACDLRPPARLHRPGQHDHSARGVGELGVRFTF